MRRRIVSLIAVLTFFVVTAPTAQAEPPDNVGPQDPVPFDIGFVMPDLEHEVFIFWNVRRSQVCPPPLPRPHPSIEKGDVIDIYTGSGAVLTKFREQRPIELWKIDGTGDNLCAVTDAHEGPWASAERYTGSFFSNDSGDVFQSGSTQRTAAFGSKGNGTVYETDGGAAWHYSWVIRNLVHGDADPDPREQERLRPAAAFTLTKRGG